MEKVCGNNSGQEAPLPSSFIPLLDPDVIGSFCADATIPCHPSLASGHFISKTQILKNNGVKAIHELWELVENTNVYFAWCNRGNCHKAIHAFVKYLCWWDKTKQRVLKHVLGIYAADDNKSGCCCCLLIHIWALFNSDLHIRELSTHVDSREKMVSWFVFSLLKLKVSCFGSFCTYLLYFLTWCILSSDCTSAFGR